MSQRSPETAVDENEDAPAPPPPSRKRRRVDNARADHVYPRKRATAACRLCRSRKTKCNNARPACDSCIASKATCVYEDPRDYSSFDPASILILDRLGQVLQRLDHLPSDLLQPGANSNPGHHLLTPDLANAGPQDLAGGLEGANNEQRSPYDTLRIPSARTTPDSILQWKIFEGRYPANYITDAMFAAQFDEDWDDEEPPNTSAKPTLPASRRKHGGGVDEDAIPELVKRFLELVHIKNPILDPETILTHAYRVAEDGPRWDAISCLILLACALGAIAQPFPANLLELPQDGNTSLEADEARLARGEAYFGMARKRIGTLNKGGLVVAQCHFLAGVYFMYTLQPLAAWYEFHSASTSHHIYLQGQARQRPVPRDPAKALRRHRLEQRLYWSCYKSECELRSEIDLPASSLADYDYPDMHPSPPDIEASNTDGALQLGGELASPGSSRRALAAAGVNQEESWFYYLTEITLRRIGNRIANAFYAAGPPSWDDEMIPRMAKEVEEVELQLQEWHDGLPAAIRFEEDKVPSRELQYMVQGRALEIRSWLYRPFLYYAIHNPHNAPCRSSIEHLVSRAVAYSFRALRSWQVSHRHHGVWYGVRGCVSTALCILGAAKCGTISLPADWRESISNAIQRVRYWEDEGPGISRAVEVLESFC